MNDAYAELNKLRHVRVDGNAALEYLAEHVDALVYELQLKNQKVEELQASYTALNQVRLYFQSNYREVPLDQFRRKLARTVAAATSKSDQQTAAKARVLFDDAVEFCIDAEQLWHTSAKDGHYWKKKALAARNAAKIFYKQKDIYRAPESHCR